MIELMVAVFLLGAVVLTGVSVEMAVRKMQNKPTSQAILFNELTPVLEIINKDYNRVVGYWNDSGVFIEPGNQGLEIRVDNGTTPGQIDGSDIWYAYRLEANGTIVYYINNNTVYQNLAIDVLYFNVTAPTGDANEAITISMGTRLDNSEPEHPINNPEVNITSTLFSRGTSVR